MLLRRLKLKNFLIYEEVDIDLANVKLASVIGQFKSDRRRSNGAGKTAFFEAIGYALFDQSRSKLKVDTIRVGKSESEVDLEFQIEDKIVRVLRKKESNGIASAFVWVDGKLAGEKVRVVNDVIVQLLGIDGLLFEKIYFFKQDDHFNFVNSNPADRKAVLAKLFKLESLDKCAELVRARKKKVEEIYLNAKGAYETCCAQASKLPTEEVAIENEIESSGNLASAIQLVEAYDLYRKDVQSGKEWTDSVSLQFQNEVDNEKIRNEALLKKLQELLVALSNVRGKLQDSNATLKGIESNIEKDQKRCEPFDGKEITQIQIGCKFQINQLENEIKKLNQEIGALKAEKKRLVLPIAENLVEAECPTCRQFVPKEHFDIFKNQFSELITKNNEQTKIAEQSLLEIENKLKKLRVDYDNVVEISALRKKIQSEFELATSLRSSIRKDREEEKRIDEERNAILIEQSIVPEQYDKNVIWMMNESLKLRKVSFRKLFDKDLDRWKEINARVASLKEIQKENTLMLIRVREVKKEVEQNKRLKDERQFEFTAYEQLSTIFSKDGIQAIIVENAISLIEMHANEILVQMQTKFELQLKTIRELKDGATKECLDVIIHDNGTAKPFENYSGGERTLINIALRLAMSKVVSSLYGIQLKTLFLDEVLGALDAVNREEVVKVISYLARSFEQVFVISHTLEIQDLIDSSIVIERHEDHSTVSVKTYGRNTEQESKSRRKDNATTGATIGSTNS